MTKQTEEQKKKFEVGWRESIKEKRQQTLESVDETVRLHIGVDKYADIIEEMYPIARAYTENRDNTENLNKLGQKILPRIKDFESFQYGFSLGQAYGWNQERNVFKKLEKIQDAFQKKENK